MATNLILNKYVGKWLAQPSPSSVDTFTAGASGPFGPTAVFGVIAPAGLYHVTLQLNIETAGLAGTLRLQVTATGRTGSTVYSLPAADVTIVGMQSGIFAVDSNATIDMSLSCVAAGLTAGSLSYSYRIICDKKSNQG